MMLKGSVLPHLSLATWEMGLFGNGKFTKRRYVAGIKCRALAALPPPPAFVHIEGGEEITDQRGNFVGYYALAKEATHSVRAVASVKGGTVKLALWTSRSEQPRLVNGSPVWRHVAKRSLFLARAEPPFFSWMVQTESDVGTARGLVYHDNTGCLSPDGCSDGHWKYAVAGGGWRRGPWRCSARRRRSPIRQRSFYWTPIPYVFHVGRRRQVRWTPRLSPTSARGSHERDIVCVRRSGDARSPSLQASSTVQ